MGAKASPRTSCFPRFQRTGRPYLAILKMVTRHVVDRDPSILLGSQSSSSDSTCPISVLSLFSSHFDEVIELPKFHCAVSGIKKGLQDSRRPVRRRSTAEGGLRADNWGLRAPRGGSEKARLALVLLPRAFGTVIARPFVRSFLEKCSAIFFSDSSPLSIPGPKSGLVEVGAPGIDLLSAPLNGLLLFSFFVLTISKGFKLARGGHGGVAPAIATKTGSVL
ncbi:hypothetical protein Nepgr_029797 [Nepenthes gracilis]|uniref:Uncharacterized protein n=1 Tax=Nepenthes gracilis TaxID=150966 RepID=A0AAD3TEZ6_NEPGR|nr:hypothetical protein Nepgr_029797 [Nepenthes gracilis]